MNILSTLWKFSRPHTIIGSVISICTLYAMACQGTEMQHLPLLFLSLVIGITCNVFIVGINQVADVEIDRINKPYLPIPAGLLSLTSASIIVYTSLVISLLLALYLTPYLFGIILVSATIGWAYSMPPFYLKRHHVPAAIAITTVRGVLVNVGGFMVFNMLINDLYSLPADIKILAAFIVVFSVVISWFKDLPDMEGDSAYHIKTLAIVYSPKATFVAGNLLVVLTYAGTIVLKYIDLKLIVLGNATFSATTLFYGHILLLGLFITNALYIHLDNHASVKKFYKRFWWFFFAEYVLYLVAYLF